MSLADPVMVALLNRLPPIGAEWPIDQRLLWLSACEATINMIYGPVEKIDIGAFLPKPASSEDDSDPVAVVAPKVDAPKKIAAPAVSEIVADVVAPEITTGDKIVIAPPKKPGLRPTDLPSNPAMAQAAIRDLGPATPKQIQEFVRRNYWPGVPDSWSACLYSISKLRRDGDKFNLIDAPRTPMPPVKPTAGPRPAPAKPAAVKFDHADRSTELPSMRHYVFAGKLRVAMGKGHVSEAFLAEAVLGSNTESHRSLVRDMCLGMNDRLAEVGLVVENYPGYGLIMKDLP